MTHRTLRHFMGYTMATMLTSFVFIGYALMFVIEYNSMNFVVGISDENHNIVNVWPCAYALDNSSCEPQYTLYNHICVFNNVFCHDNLPQSPKSSTYYEHHTISSDFTLNPIIDFMLVSSAIFITMNILFGIYECKKKNYWCDVICIIIYTITVLIFNAMVCTTFWMIPFISTYEASKYCDVVCNKEYYIESNVNYYIYSTCCSKHSVNFENDFMPNNGVGITYPIFYAFFGCMTFINFISIILPSFVD